MKKTLSNNSLDALKRINESLKLLNEKFMIFIDLQKPDRSDLQEVIKTSFDLKALFSIPGNLRKTLMVILENGISSAEEVANVTHRARAVESGYLNRLCEMGYLKKERKFKKVYFST